MSDPMAEWILKSWEDAKKSWEKTKNIKYVNTLAKILRGYIIQVKKARAGINQEDKIIGQTMVDYLNTEISGIKYNARKHSILFPALTNVQFATRHIGVTAVQGSALKRKLTGQERRSVRRLVKRHAGEDVKPAILEDDLDGHDLRDGGMDDGDSQTA
jgi:hypothetical protein